MNCHSRLIVGLNVPWSIRKCTDRQVTRSEQLSWGHTVPYICYFGMNISKKQKSIVWLEFILITWNGYTNTASHSALSITLLTDRDRMCANAALSCLWYITHSWSWKIGDKIRQKLDLPFNNPRSPSWSGWLMDGASFVKARVIVSLQCMTSM